MVQVNEKWMKSEFRKTEPRATYTYDEQLKARMTPAPTEMLRQRHKSRAGHVRPSNRNNFGSTGESSVQPK